MRMRLLLVRSSRELWTIVLGRSALREPTKDPSTSALLVPFTASQRPPRTFKKKNEDKSANSAAKVKADKNVAAPLKELGLRVSKFLSLDEEQSVQLLQCYLQEDYRGTRDSLKVPFSQCVEKLDKELVPNYRKQFEELYRAEAPTWETHGSLMTERQVSRWFVQCLREQSLLLEVIFLYYAYFEMAPEELLAFAKMFKEQGFGSRQTNRHLVDESMDHLVDRVGYFSALILVEGMEIDSLHERLLDDRKEEHKFAGSGPIRQQEMDSLLLTLGDVPHHAPILLAWALLRHTLSSEESTSVIRRMGSTAIQLNVFQYLTKLLRSISSEGNDIIDTACEVLSASSIPPLFWKTEPTAGLGIILDSVCGMFPHLLSPLLQLLTALVSDKSTAKKVYTFLDKMSFYIELYKHKPPDVISHEDGTLWRRQVPKLLYPLGLGQTNLRIPQGTVGQVMLDDRAYLHCQRVKPIIDLVHKVISTDVSIADYLLPITSRIYILLQRLTTVISPPVDVIASCVNCLTVLASRMPAKVWTDLHHTGFLPFVANPVSSISHMISMVKVKIIEAEVQNIWETLNCILLLHGYLILQLIHAILNLYPEMDPHSSNAPSLQSLCIFSLANTEAGQAVINIMGIGVDTIDMVMATQSSSDESQGQGQLLIQTVKLAFSVTNNVIRLKPPSSMVSPLEHALTQHGAHRNNLIAVLAKYIYHKHDPALPRLAIQLLKRLATVAPMSVYACLGNDAAAIRDAFLTRLQSKIEDMRIKVMILEFLTVAVETQPGLIELFLNLEVKDGNDGSKEFSLGEWSCLHVVLELIDSKQQEQYWCPPLLQRATVAFLHALWQDRRDSAMLVLRTKPKFWENLTNPLFGTLPPPCETSELSVLDTCALIMKIICLEIYCVVKGSLDQSLKDTLKKFSTEKRFAYWSGYVKSLAFHVAETEGIGCTSVTEYQMLISAWRMMLIVSASHADIMHLSDPEIQQLFLDVLSGTKTLILDGVLQADQMMMEKTKAKVFSALITVLQMKEMKVSEIPQYSQLVLSVCETLQEEFIALFDHTRHCLTSGDVTDDKDSMETDDASRHKQKDQRDGASSFYQSINYEG
ncbi:hypothetical protein JD844_004636 [Phrynosoma platyrhinos]|uniref:Nucleoporin NUP188 n=1 Tax=Phrynosoma platyrhinos TaxID=52577 RepID=A0ABQ7SDM9_PHRPL|nr:hypothetical protein JD844_004636 [Phrynosoma platyrhinos]